MNPIRIARQLLSLAKSLIAKSFPFYRDMPMGSPDSPFYKSLRSLVTSNNGLFKSEKQGKFLLGKAMRDHTKFPADAMNGAAVLIPRDVDVLAVYEISMTMKFGKGMYNQRYLEYYEFLDRFGVVKEVKLTRKYDDRTQTSEFKGFRVTFERPKSLNDQLYESITGNAFEEWVKKYDPKDIELIKKYLVGDKFYGKFVDALNEEMIINDGTMEKVIWEAKRREETAGNPTYSESPTKDELTVEVSKVKFDERRYDQFGTVSFFIMGKVEGYKEFAYIRISDNELSNKLFDDDDYDGNTTIDDMADVASKKLVGKRLRLKGTFQGNGKMIFGKRVKVISVG